MAQPLQFDYIIVGSGASGGVLANRLSKNPQNKVLVLEAGKMDSNPKIRDVGGFVSLWGSEEDWKIQTTPQPGLGDRSITINQGKVLGGSTSINAMMYVRGSRKNFDQWQQMGARGWGYDDVLPYFKRIENYSNGSNAYHSQYGEIMVRDCPDDVMRSDEFLKAATEAGFKGPYEDYNGAEQEVAGLLQFHIDEEGSRESSATVFLKPVLDRENLTLLVNALATKIIIEDGIATGVQYKIDGELQVALATKEVIISAGALASPKLLLLSGIGPAAELQQLDIEVKCDLPGVGKNLQDHLQLPILYRSTQSRPNTTLLTGNVLFADTTGQQGPADLQLNFTPSLPAPLAPILPDFGGPVCIFLAILVQPKSKGEVTLASTDPEVQAIVNPNYLQDKADLNVFYKAIEIVRKIAGAPSFSTLNGGEMAPGPGDPEQYIRTQASTLWHPAGTCKMGDDHMAVVDEQLRVKGIKKLRVADASVMPVVPSGNTVAACFMIGERAADMLLKESVKQVAILSDHT